MRYFLAVAKEENIHRAAESEHVSAAALSKAVSRLEEELGVSLFSRRGRGIQLSENGRLLQDRASDILQREESARVELGGRTHGFNVSIGGPEILLAKYGIQIANRLREKYPKTHFEFKTLSEDAVGKSVKLGEVWLGLGTLTPPRELTSKVLERSVPFQTFVGKTHPLSKFSGKVIPVEEVLKYEFVSFPRFLVGNVGDRLSPDGWRDDKFPRKIGFRVSNLSVLTEILREGLAVAYVPNHVGHALGLQALEISGCPYECKQKVYLITKDASMTGWVKSLF